MSEDLATAQKGLWQGDMGQAWVEAQGLLDRLFAPIEAYLVDAVVAAAPETVLDVGCGTGATTLDIARRLGRGARVTGVDISEPMLKLARERAASESLDVAFVTGDAQRLLFEPNAFDLVVSRFGVMFFDDPGAAFANLRAATPCSAGLHFVVWRGPEENDFMTVVDRAMAAALPDTPARKADEPGPFGLAGAERTEWLLRGAGWSDVAIEPVAFTCAIPADRIEFYYRRVGPAARLLAGADDPLAKRLAAELDAGYAAFRVGDEIRFRAACWSIRAKS